MFLGKEIKVAKKKRNSQSKNGVTKKLYISKVSCYTSIYNIQINLRKTHFRVTGIKSLLPS